MVPKRHQTLVNLVFTATLKQVQQSPSPIPNAQKTVKAQIVVKGKKWFVKIHLHLNQTFQRYGNRRQQTTKFWTCPNKKHLQTTKQM